MKLFLEENFKSLSFVKRAKPVLTVCVQLMGELKEVDEELLLNKQKKLKLKCASELLNEL
jgi:hypothetical protein